MFVEVLQSIWNLGISLPPEEESDLFLRLLLSYNHNLHFYGLKDPKPSRIDLIFSYLLQKRNTNFGTDQNFQAEKNYPGVDWVKKYWPIQFEHLIKQ